MKIKVFKNDNYNYTFFTTLIIGLLTHAFPMVNPIFNDDSIKVRNIGMESGGALLGRWFAEIINLLAKKLGYVITVPYMAYLICILLIAFSSILLIKIFDLKNSFLCMLVGAILVTSTSLIQLWSYDYTSINSTLSIFFAILSCYIVLNIDVEHINLLWLLSGIFIFACTIGIYQISIPIFLSILIIKLIVLLLVDNKSNIYVIKTGLLLFFVSILGVILYIFLNKFVDYYFLNVNFTGGHYGMTKNVISNYTLQNIKDLIVRCIAVPVLLPFINYAGICTTLYSRIIVFSIYTLSFIIIISFIDRKNINKNILLMFLIFCFIIAVNFQRIMITQLIQTRMTFSISFIFILPIILVDNITNERILVVKKYLQYLIILFVFHLMFVANANYYTAYVKNNSMKNLCNQIVSKIINTAGYDSDKPLVFIGGDINNINFVRYDFNENNLSDHYLFNPDYLFDAEARDSMFKIFANFKYTTPDILTINSESEIPTDKEVYYKLGYYGLTYSTNKDIINMPCYPDDGCVQFIDGVTVVKISN